MRDGARQKADPSLEFYSADYFDTYSEAHRRRATRFNFPAAVHLFALYHPSQFQPSFTSYIEAVLTFLLSRGTLRDDDIGIDPRAVAERIFGYYNYDNPNNLNERLVFEFDEAVYERTWRLEIHNEYIVVSIFAGLTFARRATDIQTPDTSHPDIDHLFRRRSCAGSDGPTKSDWAYIGANPDALFTEVADHCRSARDDFFNALRDWQRQFTGTRKSPGLRKGPEMFANYYGCILPWTAMPMGIDRQSDFVVFSHPESTSLPHVDGKRDDTFRRVNQYLGSIRDSKVGDVLFGPHKPDFAASYLDYGTSLFVSSLGSRRGELDRSPGSFLLLYDDEPANLPELCPSGLTSDDLDVEMSYRLGRTVARLFDLGVLRLAALRNMRYMKDFEPFLREIERELQGVPDFDVVDDSLLSALWREIQKHTSHLPEPIAYRAARTKYYQSNMTAILGALHTIEIPGWHTYSTILQRRLMVSIQNLGDIGDRFDGVQRRLTNISLSLRNLELLKIQKGGEALAKLFSAYYIPSIFRELSEVAYDFFHGFATHGLKFYICFSQPCDLEATKPMRHMWGNAGTVIGLSVSICLVILAFRTQTKRESVALRKARSKFAAH
jgi:hypothetical protein